MKKTVILLTGFLLVGSVLYAQQKHPRFLAELSFGPSFPVGKFADRSFADIYTKNPSGLAKPGLGVNFSLGYYLNKSVGVLLTSGYSENKQTWTGYNEFLKTVGYDGPPRTEIDGKSWKMVKVMGGGFFVVPLTATRKLNLLTKLTAGVCKTALPGHNNRAYAPDDRLMWEIRTDREDLPPAFCYQASVTLQYKLSKHLHVLLDINSFNASVKKTFQADLYTPEYLEHATRQYKLNTVNALLGIGVRF